jgi:hypothetical protein
MKRKNKGLLWGWLGLLLAVTVPARSQTTGCTASPDAAVMCFVKNAVSAGLTTLPAGMTLRQYKAYGVSVSNMVQTPLTLVFLLGTMGAAADALPAVNADGVTPNQAAQDAAIGAIMDAALRDGLIALPAGTTADQLKLFAHSICGAMAQYGGVSIAPGSLLRFLDSYLVNATMADGTVDWNKVRTNISTLVDSLVASGLLKLPAGGSADNVKQFASDVAVIIHDYKVATGKTTL